MSYRVELARVVTSAWDFLVEKHEGSGSLGEIRCMWRDTIKIVLK
jgi:hypothetical protein